MWSSETKLVMSLTADRKMLSNFLSAGWSTDGEHRRRYWTRGALTLVEVLERLVH